MKELQEILVKVARFAPDEKAILATVVDVVGSGYRRPGARMLIDANGFSIGTVSGGCLEADVLERAKRVLETGESTVITYDTTRDENSVFGLSMGCRGVVRILLEKVSGENSFFECLRDVFETRKSFSMATVVFSKDNNSEVGKRFFRRDGKLKVQGLKPSNPYEVKEKLKMISTKSNCQLEEFDFGEVFFETIAPPLNLLLFGAGFDALPLVRFAKELGWRVTTIDHRAAYNNSGRIPESDEIIVSGSEDLPEELFKDENSVAVIMTHNYERDREILYRLLNSSCRYIGALGPKSRTEKLIGELRGAGRTFNENNLKNLHAPIGLDIGSETPEEIALAVVAEIKTALSNRRGGFLRDRNGPING